MITSLFGGGKKKPNDGPLGPNKPRLSSKVYFAEELILKGFTPAYTEVKDVDIQISPSKPIMSSSKVFIFSPSHTRYIDIMNSEDDERVLISSLNADRSHEQFRMYLNQLYSKFGGTLVPNEIVDDIDRYQDVAKEHDKLPKPTKRDTNLGKRLDVERDILKDIYECPELLCSQIARKRRISKSLVSSVLKSVLLNGTLPCLSRKPTKKYLKLPPKTELQLFFDQEWVTSGCISDNWKTLVAKLKLKYPYLSQFKDKTISNHLRKLMRVRSVTNKRLQYKASPIEFLAKQLALGLVITKLHFTGEKIIYFDQSSVQLGSFNNKSIGTSELVPVRSTPVFPQTIFFMAAITIDGFVAIQFLKNNATTSQQVYMFISSVMERLLKTADSSDAPGWYLVMDNAGYHKTKEIKSLCNKYPLHILYTVPCSPFLNLIEDFFLTVKRYFRSRYYTQYSEATDLLCQGIRSAIEEGFSWIMRKHIGIMQQKLNTYQRMKTGL